MFDPLQKNYFKVRETTATSTHHDIKKKIYLAALSSPITSTTNANTKYFSYIASLRVALSAQTLIADVMTPKWRASLRGEKWFNLIILYLSDECGPSTGL